jgi:hypothetical protein
METKKPQARTENDIRPDWNSSQPLGLISRDIHKILLRHKPPAILRQGAINYDGTSIGYVSWDFNKVNIGGRKNIELLHITDVQYGHVFCDEKRVVEYRDWVLSEPNRFMLWGGDMVDAGGKTSVGSTFEQKKEPQGQIYEFCKLWAPAAHRVLGFIGGNHERRTMDQFGDLGKMLSFILQIPYSLGQQRIDVYHAKHNPFSVRLWHGSGGSQTSGAKMIMLDRMMQRGDNDLYLTGHLHDAMLKFKWREVRDPKALTIKLKKVGGAMSSSFLEYFHSYAEVKNLEPTGLMMARAILEPDGHWELTLR